MAFARGEAAMVSAIAELVLRSLEADWCHERWEQLPDDGKCYEVIDGFST